MNVDHIEIAKLELQRGDILLVRVPPDWTHEKQSRVHDAMKMALDLVGITVPVLIGGTDIELQIIRKDANQKETAQ